MKRRFFLKTSMLVSLGYFCVSGDLVTQALASEGKPTDDPGILEVSSVAADRLPGVFISVKAIVTATGYFREQNVQALIQVSEDEHFTKIIHDEVVIAEANNGYLISKKFPDNAQGGKIYVRVSLYKPQKKNSKKTLLAPHDNHAADYITKKVVDFHY